jgi:S-ribosylhomocysteine lyase
MENAIQLLQESMAFIRDFQGEIPGSKQEECGNYLAHNLQGANELGKDMCEVLKDWTVEKLHYEK